MTWAAAIYLVYALSFVVSATAILAQPRHSKFEVGPLLWLFAAYAYLHCIGDFIDALQAAAGNPETQDKDLGELLTFLSYFFLFEFGRRVWGLSGRSPPWWTLPVLAMLALGLSLGSNDPWTTGDVLVGYLVRTPAGCLAGIGLLRYYRGRRAELDLSGARRFFLVGSGALLIWSFFCGIVRAPADFFPANVLNVHSVELATNVPTVMFRALCGVVTAWAMVGILRIFDWDQIRSLEAARAEAESAKRAQERIMAIVSHDLRQPLSAILGYAHILGNSKALGPQEHKGAEAIDRSARRLGRMVDDLIDVQRVQSGVGIVVERTPGDLGSIGRPIVEDIGGLHPERALEFRAEGDCRGAWDAGRMAQVLQNLVTNALTHGDETRPVTVRVRGERGLVTLEVHNDGEPIDPAFLPVIFDPFSRAPSGPTHGTQGLGLGLHIVWEIVKAHGGAVTAQSTREDGTRFVASFPQ